ncbi:MAG: GNAT family N-acetyltransferase [Anaerolineae bacterium]|nr:GNAT family N-acetyltransferase [Anaerolineae bacterium]
MSSQAHDHFVRRIFLPHELEQIKEQQRNAREFQEHYPYHMPWLERALEEVSAGKRILFGVFRSAIDHRGHAFTELVGSLMLKRNSTEYTNVNSIEIKNLYLLDAYRREGRGTAIYTEAERYCAQNGYSQIVTEVPCIEITTVKFLLKMGFRVEETKLSPYTNNEYIYVMVKTLFPSFTGDHFDLDGIAYWIAENYFHFSALKWVNENQWLEFRVEDRAALAEIDQATQEQLSIKGIVMISDDDMPVTVESVASALETKNYHLALVIGKHITKSLENYSRNKEVKLIDIKTIYNNLDRWFTHKQVHFEKEDIAGMIVPMNPQFFEKLINTKPIPSEFTYFKTGDVGKYLKPDNVVLINVEPSREYPEGGIKGYGVVKSLLYGRPDEVWAAYKDKNPIFDENSFRQYVGDREFALGIHLQQFTQIQSIHDEDVAEIMLSSTTKIPRYFYFNFAMRENLFKRIKVLNTLEPDPSGGKNRPYCFISYSRKDEKYATQLENDLLTAGIGVWRDASRIEPGADWPNELAEAIENCSHFLLVATDNALASKYVQDEIVFARNKGKAIIPLLHENINLPLLLSSTQAMNFYSNYVKGLNLLLEHLKSG